LVHLNEYIADVFGLDGQGALAEWELLYLSGDKFDKNINDIFNLGASFSPGFQLFIVVNFVEFLAEADKSISREIECR